MTQDPSGFNPMNVPPSAGSDDSSWLLYAIGASAIAVVGGTVFIAYKAAKAAAPVALAYHAPELLPIYEACERGEEGACRKLGVGIATRARAAQEPVAPVKTRTINQRPAYVEALDRATVNVKEGRPVEPNDLALLRIFGIPIPAASPAPAVAWG